MTFFGEIKMFAGSGAVPGFLPCNGQILPVAGYEGLLAAIGPRFGGDGITTIGLPDMRGRIPVHIPWAVGLTLGAESVTLDLPHMPAHSHDAGTSAVATSNDPLGNVFAGSGSNNWYIAGLPTGSLDVSAVAPAGGSLPHSNLGPYLALGFFVRVSGGLIPA